METNEGNKQKENWTQDEVVYWKRVSLFAFLLLVFFIGVILGLMV